MNQVPWRDWVMEMFPYAATQPFGDHHAAFWDWAWAITPESTPDPFVAAWARGGAKSSTLELVVAATILRDTRRYGLYVGETQEQADDHVSTIGTLLESSTVATRYPHHADRAVGKYGNSRGWRRNRLQTRGGAIVDAIGLDAARRGAKIEHQRPDFLAFDDIDGKHDTQATTKRKIATITTSILPMGSGNAAVAFVQNLIIPNGVQSQLVTGKADFLHKRKISGPIPAIVGLKTESVFDETAGRLRDIITEGRQTWDGQDLRVCQDLIDRFGLSAFLRECQHMVQSVEGTLWTTDTLNECRTQDVPTDRSGAAEYVRIVIGVDPSGGSAEIGIIAAGLGRNGHVYVLADRTQAGRLGPHNWGYQTVRLYDEMRADCIAAESNFGGDMVESTIRVQSRTANVKLVSAARGKQVRAEPVAALYGAGLVHHVGSFPELEQEMTSWVPGLTKESPNRIDALVWAVTELALKPVVHTGVVGSIRLGRR